MTYIISVYLMSWPSNHTKHIAYHTKSPWPAQLLNVWVLFLFFTHQSIHSRQLSENISYAKIVSAKLPSIVPLPLRVSSERLILTVFVS